MNHGHRAFTLIEMLAVLFLTALVLWVAIDFFLDLSDASRAAVLRTRDGRQAAAILDRVARDLEGATLVVKPPELDPLDHPWLFLAEAQSGATGADRLKFVTRANRPRASQLHASDLAMVSYALVQNEDDETYRLMRSLRSALPEGLDRNIPSDERDGAVLFAEGLASFSVRLLDEEGGWVESWDSSTLTRASDLPVAAEITLALAGVDGAQPVPHSRRVRIPIRPLDLAQLLNNPDQPGGEAAKDGEEDGNEVGEADGGKNAEEATSGEAKANARTISECINVAALPPQQQAVLRSLGNFSFDDYREQIQNFLPAELILCK